MQQGLPSCPSIVSGAEIKDVYDYRAHNWHCTWYVEVHMYRSNKSNALASFAVSFILVYVDCGTQHKRSVLCMVRYCSQVDPPSSTLEMEQLFSEITVAISRAFV